MTTDILFPFFDILVNTIFGNILVSLIAVGVVMSLLLALGRSSWVFILFWMIFYVMVTLTFYIGAIGMVLTMIIAAMYLMTQIVRMFFPDR